jgi:opacity protein-like surface antigen
MKKLLLVAALSVATTSVFAQAKNFEGFFVEGGLAIGSADTKTTYTQGDYSDTAEDGGKNYLKGQMSIGYMKAINEKFLIGASVGTVLGSITVGESSNSDGERDLTKAKNNYSIALIPAYALSDKLVVRGRISYNKSKVEGSGVGSDDNEDLYNYTQSAKVSGFGLGVGAQYFITKNVYAAIDIERVQYSSKNMAMNINGQPFTDGVINVKPSNTVGLISVGYKF